MSDFIKLNPDLGANTYVVFSHPNHELAIFGLLQRLRPHLIYLTDGGGEERVEQTRQGLRAIDLERRATFLNHSEQSFYDALLGRDVAFFETVAEEVLAAISERPEQVLFDAVEFYNPVHDLSLPLVKSAFKGTQASLFEIPLIHQSAPDTYRVQRPSKDRSGQQTAFALSDKELEAKLFARANTYTLLAGQLGSVLEELAAEQLAVEVVIPAGSCYFNPSSDVILRYDERAKLLHARGEIRQPITYSGNYLPIAEALVGLSVASSRAEIDEVEIPS